jgi:hypothetical protein
VVPVAPPVVPVPAAPVPVAPVPVSPVVPVPPVVPPVVPLVPEVLLGAVAAGSVVVLVGSVFLQAPSTPRLAIKAAVSRNLGAFECAFIVLLLVHVYLVPLPQVRRWKQWRQVSPAMGLLPDEGTRRERSCAPVQCAIPTVNLRLAKVPPVRRIARVLLASAVTRAEFDEGQADCS